MAKNLKTFLVLYHAPMASLKQMGKMSPEDKQKGMALWMKWAKKCGDKLINMGAPLGGGVALDPAGSSPSKKNVAGYSIVQAASMAGAQSLMKGHPHFGYAKACTIEVHEVLPMPG